MSQGTEPAREAGGFEDVHIPVGGSLWRVLGASGALGTGYALAAGYLATVVGGSLLDLGTGLGRIVLVLSVVLPLLAACFCWVGELQRRGRWGGPSGRERGSVLPQGSTTVTVRLLPPAWHLAWLLALLAVCVLLLLAVTQVAAAGESEGREAFWVVHGLLLSGVAGATAGSLVKKLVWVRTRERSLALRRSGTRTRGRNFWRWFGYRWRLDLWVCALGSLTLWAAGWVAALRFAFPREAEEIVLVSWLVGALGLVVLVAGLLATAHFWRAGEDLAGSESVA